MNEMSFQDQGSVAHCFGCGADNLKGLRLKSFWDGNEAVAVFKPQPYHCGASPGIAYGGLLACLIDCHTCNLAIAQAYREENRSIGSEPKINYVTAQINVSLQKPTPMDTPLHLRARIKAIDGRKTWVECEVIAKAKVTAYGEVLAIRLEE